MAVALRLRATALLAYGSAGKDARGALLIRNARKSGCRCGSPATQLSFFPHAANWQHILPDEMWTCDEHAGMSGSRLIRLPGKDEYQFTAYWNHATPCPLGMSKIARFMGPSRRYPVYVCPHRSHN